MKPILDLNKHKKALISLPWVNITIVSNHSIKMVDADITLKPVMIFFGWQE